MSKKSNNIKKKGRKPIAKILDKECIDDACLIAHIPITIDKITNYNQKNIEKPKIKSNVNKPVIELFTEVKKKTSIEEKLREKINLLEKKIINLQQNSKEKNQESLHYNYSSIMYNNNIKKNNNLKCWWCCHEFENHPVYLPESYNNDKYNVYGYFCSFNCTMAYNVDLNDSKIWDRSFLLNNLHYKVTNKYIKIKPAPSRYCLDIFGGKLNIESFREKSISNKSDFRFIKPPLNSIIPIIEEKNYNNKNIISNDIKISSKLVLQRSKPLKNHNNSIQKAMNLESYS